MRTTAQHLTFTIRAWPDLRHALSTTSSAPTTWPPAGRMNDHIRTLDNRDEDQLARDLAETLLTRTLERADSASDAPGQHPIPIRLPIHETMRIVRAALVECADQIAASVQRPVMSLLPDGYPKADRARRELLVMQDRRDPRRWNWTSARPDAPYAALWLLGRVQGASGPFRPLTAPQLDHISVIARGCTRRIEDALDTGERKATLARPCPDCGGRLQLHGGAGANPVARCTGCGQTWAQQDTPAVA